MRVGLSFLFLFLILRFRPPSALKHLPPGNPVLFGDVNPSAHLALTMPNKDNEIGFTQRQYPGADNGEEAYYDEKLLVGLASAAMECRPSITPSFPAFPSHRWATAGTTPTT